MTSIDERPQRSEPIHECHRAHYIVWGEGNFKTSRFSLGVDGGKRRANAKEHSAAKIVTRDRVLVHLQIVIMKPENSVLLTTVV